ncbi:MAG: hypothetical protein Q3959_03895 [Limosilactobacillus sp.]|uniref:hypothetical protein n=1 Tax=Limosilactobacillus sp. TaxID=2773925 RepID=UPI0026FBA8E0|nr:hypothetical protein [Limosilactobacillus sp.]
MIILACICTAIVFAYRYYANQYAAEHKLTQELIQTTKENLRNKNIVNNSSNIEFEGDNR